MAGILAFGLMLIAVAFAAEDSIELSLTPAGVLKKGDELTITCTVKELGDFDVLKIIRNIENPKTGQSEAVTLAVNGNVVSEFMDTGRYMATADYESSTFTLTIKDSQGVDGGNMGCEHAGSRNSVDFREEAMEYVTIYVPLETVQIRTKSSSGWTPVDDDGKVVMRIGQEDGVECYAEVFGSDLDIKPKITFTIGSTDGTTYKDVEHDSEYEKSIDNKQLSRIYRTWYKFESSAPDKAFNEQEITCTASIKEYEPITTTAMLSIEYAPELECRTTTYAKLGEEAVKVTCKASMNPEPTASFWTWGGSDEQTMLNTNDLVNGFGAERTQLGDNMWEFHLVVANVNPSTIQEYTFSVENGLGEPVTKKAALEEVEEIPTTEPTTTTSTSKPNPKYDNPKSDPQMNEVIGADSGVGAVPCLTPLMLVLATAAAAIMRS